MNHILFCPNCKKYTIAGQCSSCNAGTIMPKPARYGPEDPYSSYRRQAKEAQLRAKGWL